ncbi:MAG TPA: glycosyltransferase family 1 protein [Pedobacter sp.]|jgi:glycosyltransferase involved in cell wall biosynthesis
MRIAFDGKRAVQNFTGLGNYSRFVLELLAQHFPENEYFVYAQKSLPPGLAQLNKIELRQPPPKKFNALWRSYGIVKDLKRDKISLYHGLSNELPFGITSAKIPSVVTIHDLIFLRFPEFYPFIDRVIYKYKFKFACENASRIIAVSEQTKEDIINYFGISEDKIDVVYQGCNKIFQEPSSDELKRKISRKYKLPKQYLLQVGTIERRKNLLLTVKALKNIPRTVKLVVIGKDTAYLKEVKALITQYKLDRRVIFLKNVPLEDLPPIYQQAQIFIYPSEFEGFGIPIIEALHSGIPVIAAIGSCLEEAGGPHSSYIHPQDDIQLSWSVNSILNNPDLGRNMVEKGFEYVKKFNTNQLAENLMNTYQKVLNHA